MKNGDVWKSRKSSEIRVFGARGLFVRIKLHQMKAFLALSDFPFTARVEAVSPMNESELLLVSFFFFFFPSVSVDDYVF